MTGRKKIPEETKNRIRSVSITPEQDDFISSNNNFDLSKFVQIHLKDFIEFRNELDNITIRED